MSTRYFRLTVVACAASWLLLGMHAPVVHEITGHGRAPSVSVLVAVTLVLTVAVVSLWMLLRESPRPGGGPTAPHSSPHVGG